MSESCTLLLVDDDPGAVAVMARVLQGLGDLRFATSGEAALELAQRHPPDLVLLDAEMPGLGGFETCRRLKAMPALARVPVIFVTSHAEPAFELVGLEAGAADFIAKPVNPPLLLARVRTQLRMKQLTDQLHQLSVTDALTGLANRRSFDEALALEWQRARRAGDGIGLVLFDVDHFKRYNDRHGHPAGDACLQRTAQAVAACAKRPADVAARYGGEEFAVLLPHTGRQGTQALAQQLVEAVAALQIEHADSPTARYVTVSAGAACYDDSSSCWLEAGPASRFAGAGRACGAAELLRAADAALYAAKRAGRNRAWWLDAADADAPAAARAVGAP